MSIMKHRTGARGEAIAIAWLISRDWYVFKCFQSHSPADIVAIKMQGSRPAQVLMLEVRYQGIESGRPEGLSYNQLKAGVKLMIVHHDGHVDLDPEWSRRSNAKKSQKPTSDTDQEL